MLQQTQASRVVSKYLPFLASYPSVSVLASASLAEVLAAWQGLGYLRRAKYLWQAAGIVDKTFNGRVPTDVAALQSLPGIGAYTARAIATFATNHPQVFIETNIRTVFGYHFFPDTIVSDKQLEPVVELFLDIDNPRAWYNALMDYGWRLKRLKLYQNSQTKAYRAQSPYYGSRRQTRAQILTLLASQSLKDAYLVSLLDSPHSTSALTNLEAEGFICRHGSWWSVK